MRRIGVTATRNGLTGRQVTALRQLLLLEVKHLEARGLTAAQLWISHGDCVGGDATIDAWAAFYGASRSGHPGPGPYRAWCITDVTAEPKGFLDRDRDIVDEGQDELWVFPKEGAQPASTRGSGTWYTENYAASVGRPRIIVWPLGTTEYRYLSATQMLSFEQLAERLGGESYRQFRAKYLPQSPSSS